MVTAAVLFIIMSSTNKSFRRLGSSLSCITGFLYLLTVSAVCFSRLFIATHFPHQVLLGAIIGTLIGWLICRNPYFSLLPSFQMGFIFAILLMLTALFVYQTLHWLGWDPASSIPKAKQWCQHADWVHLDTTPFFALSRDCGATMGLTICSIVNGHIMSSKTPYTQKRTLGHQMGVTALTVISCQLLEKLPLPFHSLPLLFYVTAICKYALVPVVTMFIARFA